MPDSLNFTQPMPPVSASDLIDPLSKVSDVMTAPPGTCSPASTVLEAALVMRDRDCSVMPVSSRIVEHC